MYEITSFDCSRIAQDLQIRKVQVEAVVQLFDEGNTVPFITRYRKERTGGLNEEVIRQIQMRIAFLRQLGDRKQTILKSLEAQGKLSDDLRQAIQNADTTKRLEDLYLPYKPKKKSLASAARERGLEPLALAVWNRDAAVPNFEELLPSLIDPDKQLHTVDDIRNGVQHILAEMIAETADVRHDVRTLLWETGKIKAVKSDKLAEGQGLEYKDYFDFSEPARQIPAHRILALNRGEKENALKVSLEFNFEIIQDSALKALAGHLLTSGVRGPAPSAKKRLPGLGKEQKSAGEGSETGTVSQEPAGGTQQVNAGLEESPAGTGDLRSQDVAWSPDHATTSGDHTTTAASSLAAGQEQASIGQEVSPAEPSMVRPSEVNAQTSPTDAQVVAPPVAEAAAGVSETSVAASSSESGSSMPANTGPANTELSPVITLAPTVGESLVPGGEYRTPHAAFLRRVLDDALTRLLLPSLEREIRHELTDEAEAHAVSVFARNLRSLLLQPPLHGKRVLAIDPGLRTGCKIAVLDEYGNLLEHTVIYPFGSQPKKGPREKKKGQPQDAAEQKTAPSDVVAPTEVAAPATPPPAQDTPPAEPPPAAPSPELAPPVATGPIAAETAGPQPTTDQGISSATSVPAAPVGEAPGTEASVAPITGTETPPSETPAAASPDRKAEAKAKLKELVVNHQVQIVALGNGTGCRETEEIIADLIATDVPDLAYVIVNEAGASVYSVSVFGREEFPNFDSTLRSTISIGRRLQDPLSELVKVEAPSIGVGLYQHDIKRKELTESLDAVVESCVNQVGVDLNTASVPLLRHVSGLNQLVARDLVELRQKNGPFVSRDQLLQVPGMGPMRFTQSAGFLKIPGGANPFDRTWIHPESYPLAEKILADLGYAPQVLDDKQGQAELQAKLKSTNPEELARKLGAGVPTVFDILQSLARPGRDPRDDLPPPIFKKGILKLEDLQPNMELKGTVLNVVDFGAFVDIGLKDSGLVHISQMANRYIKSPYEVVAVSDVVTVWVLSVDKDRHRVSLTMIQPGTERKPPERKPLPPRDQQQHGRPPRERRQPVGAGVPAGQGQQEQGQVQQRADQGRGQRPEDRGRRQDDRGRRPPRGRPGQRRGPAPGQPAHAENQGAPPELSKPAAPPPPAPPPRKPRRETPKPKLSQDALEGKVPLRTFGELSVLFETKKEKKPEPREAVAAPVPVPPPVAEAPVAAESGVPAEQKNP